MRHRHQEGAGRTRNTTSQVVIGMAVIAFGLLFLLDNLGLLDFDVRFDLWPMIFVVAGALKYMQSDSGSGKASGGILFGLGILLLLKSMGLIIISWRILAPLLMIAAGVAVVFKSTRDRKPDTQYGLDNLPPGADHDSVVQSTALLGGIERRIMSQDFRGGEVTAIMGSCQLDLRAASIGSVAVLNVFAMWGGIEIKVPADWTVSLEGTPLLGGFSERTIMPPHGGKRLVIRGYALMGGVEVRN